MSARSEHGIASSFETYLPIKQPYRQTKEPYQALFFSSNDMALPIYNMAGTFACKKICMDAIGVNRISVSKVSFLGVEEGVPRCRTMRSSVPNDALSRRRKNVGHYPLIISLVQIHSREETHQTSVVIFFLCQSSGKPVWTHRLLLISRF